MKINSARSLDIGAVPVTVLDWVGIQDNLDYYQLSVPSAGELTMALSADTPGFYGINLWDEDMVEIFGNNLDIYHPSRAFSIDLASPGAYYGLVWASGDASFYNLTVGMP